MRCRQVAICSSAQNMEGLDFLGIYKNLGQSLIHHPFFFFCFFFYLSMKWNKPGGSPSRKHAVVTPWSKTCRNLSTSHLHDLPQSADNQCYFILGKGRKTCRRDKFELEWDEMCRSDAHAREWLVVSYLGLVRPLFFLADNISFHYITETKMWVFLGVQFQF